MSQILKIVALSLAFLLPPLAAQSLETSSLIATISSASTDDSPSASIFELSVQSAVEPTGLTTTTNFALSLILRPQTGDLSKSASVYAVIVANNLFYKLEPDGSYAPWNGAAETLTPFTTEKELSASQSLTLINGTMAAPGDYSFFAAYSITGETKLHFTPEPAQVSVKASTELPDNTASQAAVTFVNEVESDIVQERCIACHVEGGLARNSPLQFQRTNTASALNNFSTFSSYLEKEEKRAELLLSKITGGDGHAGGRQLSAESDGYKAIQKVIDELGQLESKAYYVFSGFENAAMPHQVSFLSEVTLEPRLATLRRATLLMQGRLPTEAERNSVVSDATLRIGLRNLMSGAAFREFVVTSVNDRLLTKGTNSALNDAYQHYLKLHNRKAEESLNDINSSVIGAVQKSLKRTSGELVAHVIESELPYSEILTAEYMMMNSTLSTWLEGTALFSEEEGTEIYKPSVVQGYYFNNALEEVEFHENSNSIYRAIGQPLKNFPHAGLLNDFGFISRYPTTATNRNRARARWTFYHFLGIDIEKSSQRPTDEASLSDRNNPTMNNQNCTVCHALLDPVAGAFQNWDENNFYRGANHDGSDALDSFYKYPKDGTQSLYRPGDLWYRDMREPGLFDKKITERDTTLRALADLIVTEPLFLTGSASFWWSPVFGKPLLNKPAVEADNGYVAKLTAYRAQLEAIEGFAEALSVRFDAKDMLVEMFMSAWFSGETVASYAFDSAHYESKFGSNQLLTPEQLAKKTRSLTGVAWRTNVSPSGNVNSKFDELGVLLGGIDSEAVTSRAIELTPTMTAVLMTVATESSCIAVARQFAKSRDSRSLFTLVEQTTKPLLIESSLLTLPSEAQGDWKTVSLTAELTTGPKEISITFTNPYCDYDGSQCLEQRKLYVESLSIISPSGIKQSFHGNDPRLETSYSNGNPNCYQQHQGWSLCFSGTLSLDLNITEPGRYIIESEMSSELAPKREGYLEILLNVASTENILTANTPNAAVIREQISALFYKLHGTIRAPDSDEVAQVYEVFAAALMAKQQSDGSDWKFENCSTWRDGYFVQDLLSPEVIETFRTVEPGKDWYQDDWEILGPLLQELTQDSLGTKYAWTAVMMYMLTHYDYLHE
ncbi:MAG: hypothetical protein ACI8W1_002329 [Candidatus Azotimanducaceae bacterium]